MNQGLGSEIRDGVRLSEDIRGWRATELIKGSILE